MNKELILAIEALEKENGIDKEIMFDAIEKSLMDEYKAEFDKADNGRVVLDRRTGDFHIYSDRTVVEEENRKRMHSTTSFTPRRRKSLQVLYRELTTMVI